MDFLMNFFSELVTRLQSKSPKFFVVWQYIFAILTMLTFIPQALAFLKIHLLGPQAELVSTTVSAATAALWFMAKMPVKPTIVTMTTDGTILQKTTDKKLPITEAAQKKEAVKEGAVGTVPLNEVIQAANK